MTLTELQDLLKRTGRYAGAIDGEWGALTAAGILLALSDGPDTGLSQGDIIGSAQRLGVQAAAIKAIITVEAGGAGFFAGRPLILFEPHRFSRATKHRFDQAAPSISYPLWDPKKYPRSQDERYAQLLSAVRLDVDAGFASASYGRFQIMGESFHACGYASSAEFAFAMARDEPTQLRAFEMFLRSTGLVEPMKRLDWAALARGYNGTAFAKNRYDSRLAEAFAAAGGLVN